MLPSLPNLSSPSGLNHSTSPTGKVGLTAPEPKSTESAKPNQKENNFELLLTFQLQIGLPGPPVVGVTPTATVNPSGTAEDSKIPTNNSTKSTTAESESSVLAIAVGIVKPMSVGQLLPGSVAVTTSAAPQSSPLTTATNSLDVSAETYLVVKSQKQLTTTNVGETVNLLIHERTPEKEVSEDSTRLVVNNLMIPGTVTETVQLSVPILKVYPQEVSEHKREQISADVNREAKLADNTPQVASGLTGSQYFDGKHGNVDAVVAEVNHDGSSALANSLTPIMTPFTAPTPGGPTHLPAGEQVAHSFIAHADLVSREGSTDFHLRLEPPDLGTVHVYLRASEGTLSARVVVAQENTQHLLASHEHDLRQSLAQAGIALSGFDVSRDGDPSRWDQQTQSEQDTFANTLSGWPATTKAAPIQVVVKSRGQVDVLA